MWRAQQEGKPSRSNVENADLAEDNIEDLRPMHRVPSLARREVDLTDRHEHEGCRFQGDTLNSEASLAVEDGYAGIPSDF